MTCGGILEASTTLISGSPGTGKTLLAVHYIHAGLENGEPAVYVSFEANSKELLNGAEGVGLNLRPFIESGLLKMIYVSPIELDVDEHVYEIEKLVREAKAKRLVIDSISSFEIGMSDKIQYTDYIWALTDYFKTQGISVLLTHEMHGSGSISEFTKHGISFIADNLIMLHFLERDLDLKRYIRVIKMLNSNHSTRLHELKIEKGKVLIESSLG